MTLSELTHQRRRLTEQKLTLFERQFGTGYRLLAYHAALPLILTPELVHYLRTEFLGDEVPWEAEADLLLSDLCSQVGYELYAMDSDVRAYLLGQSDKRVPPNRMVQVAKLLMSYVNYLSQINPGQRERELQAQRWAAMAYLGDESCRHLVEELSAQFAASGAQGHRNSVKAEFARLARITQELALQLERYPELLDFAREVNRVIRDPASLTTAERQRKFVVGEQVLELPGVVEADFPPLEFFDFIDAKLSSSHSESIPTFPPPLQTEEFTVGKIQSEAEPPQRLQRFEFEVATLSQQKTQWQIQRQWGAAYQFMERLPDNLPLEMVSIPAGTLMMGSPEREPGRFSEESPQHEVTVKSFFLGRYPITQVQWRAVSSLPLINCKLDPAPSAFPGDKRPVERVTWHEAVEFCDRLAQYSGRSYRLPSEAEWEYACRAGTTTPFHFGDMITTELANFDGSEVYANGPKGQSLGETTSVNHFNLGNAFGLSDMHGNVYEWCQNHWVGSYEGAPCDGTARLTAKDDSRRVMRGGSWISYPRFCRSAFRDFPSPDDRLNFIGFRVVCSAPSSLP